MLASAKRIAFRNSVTTIPRAAKCPQHRSLATRALDPSKTAVVLIEYQNEFTTPGGKLHEAVKEVMESTNMLANTQKLVSEARQKGVLVVHVPITFKDDYGDIPNKGFGILDGVYKGECFKKSDWGGAICDVLAPTGTDVVVEGKKGLCGFEYTNLDKTLKDRGIKTIALGGFLTNCCVESTMRTAYDKGYQVFTLKDACAATSQAGHDAAINYTFPMFSVPVTHDEFLAQL